MIISSSSVDKGNASSACISSVTTACDVGRAKRFYEYIRRIDQCVLLLTRSASFVGGARAAAATAGCFTGNEFVLNPLTWVGVSLCWRGGWRGANCSCWTWTGVDCCWVAGAGTVVVDTVVLTDLVCCCCTGGVPVLCPLPTTVVNGCSCCCSCCCFGPPWLTFVDGDIGFLTDAGGAGTVCLFGCCDALTWTLACCWCCLASSTSSLGIVVASIGCGIGCARVVTGLFSFLFARIPSIWPDEDGGVDGRVLFLRLRAFDDPSTTCGVVDDS